MAVTAHAESPMRVRALMAGFNTYIAKPVDPAELTALIVQQAGRVDAPEGLRPGRWPRPPAPRRPGEPG